jgi:hypothetical protein
MPEPSTNRVNHRGRPDDVDDLEQLIALGKLERDDR